MEQQIIVAESEHDLKEKLDSAFEDDWVIKDHKSSIAKSKWGTTRLITVLMERPKCNI